MKILIFAGTKNGRILVETLAKKKYDLLVSSMSEHGNNLLANSNNIKKIFGKKTMEEIINIIKNDNIDLVIDSTHPYAKEISLNIKEACKIRDVKLVRYERKSLIANNVGKHFESMKEVCDYLSDRKGNILFTTGVNEVNNIVKYIDVNRIYVRIIPVKSSVDKAKENLIMDQVIVMNPPFSLTDNLDHIIKYDIKYLVTKDSGAEGNSDEKIEAINLTNTNLLVIDRPIINYEYTFYNEEDLIKYINT